MEERAQDFVDFVEEQRKYYLTNHILVTMGEDFQYQAAHSWFMNLDKLIQYINSNQEKYNINIFYSTPGCYHRALMATKTFWPEKTDDFLPYASDPHSYWTGYYTSRPSSKLFMRQGELWSQVFYPFYIFLVQLTFLKIYNQMVVIKNIDISESSESLERAVAVNQHHDAITGTEKQRVANNYHARLFKAVEVIFVIT